LGGGMLVVWGWTRWRRGPIHRLEATGAAIVVLAFGMTFTFRGEYESYDNLRDLRWYNAIPQIGAVLFAGGWLTALSASESTSKKTNDPFGRLRDGFSVVLLLVILLTLHVPRVQKLFFSRMPPLTPSEKMQYPVPWLLRLRDIYLASENSARQRRGLARLDGIQTIARRAHLSRTAIRGFFGRVDVTGWPHVVKHEDALNMLDLPESGTNTGSPALAELQELVLIEPEARPPWIKPEETWPPPRTKDEE
jgi:hypothetical protein